MAQYPDLKKVTVSIKDLIDLINKYTLVVLGKVKNNEVDEFQWTQQYEDLIKNFINNVNIHIAMQFYEKCYEDMPELIKLVTRQEIDEAVKDRELSIDYVNKFIWQFTAAALTTIKKNNLINVVWFEGCEDLIATFMGNVMVSIVLNNCEIDESHSRPDLQTYILKEANVNNDLIKKYH